MTQHYLLGMLGTAAFAASGVLAVNRKGLDAFGALVLGLVTAIGGGTIRDMILSAPIFWIEDLNYVWTAVAAALAAFFFERLLRRTQNVLLYLDAVGVALFAVAALQKVLALHFSATVAVIMAVLTSIGGGLLRDVLADRPTLLMSREIYATPVLLGCTLYLLLQPLVPSGADVVAMTSIVGVRAMAIRWHLEMPAWLTNRGDAQR